MTDLSYLEAVVLGLIQGLTEFLPVSSSGHLVAISDFFGERRAEDLTLDIVLHVATLAAIVIVFRQDLRAVFVGLLSAGEGRRRVGALVLGTVPAGLVGVMAKDSVSSLPQEWPYVVPVCWLVMAGILFSLRKRGEGTAGALLGWGALWVGCFQVFALLPGISRSGLTIAAALWWGARRDEAATFSFLVAIPLIGGAGLLGVRDLVASEASVAWGPTLAGAATAFVAGYLALRLLLVMLQGSRLHYWGYYLVGVAAAYGTWIRFS